MKLLVIEDDANISFALKRFFAEQGYEVNACFSLAEAYQLHPERHDFIILDLSLPDGEGFEYLDYVRSREIQTPIILLTVRDQERDVVRGLKMGADDYITKPFSLAVLKARIETILRRALPDKNESSLQCGTLKLDRATKTAFLAGKTLELSQREYELLEYLTLYIDDVPFRYIGKGEQGSLKTKLALQTKMDKSQIIMVEEPETNLSYSNLNKLVNSLLHACCDKQLIITTHSTFLMNKIGIDKVIFLNGQVAMTMNDISASTKDYFKKLPGYDTLRMIIAQRSILVEGRCDELIVQKAYYQIYGKLPLDDGIDIITVGGLVFKRFMEIAKKLNKQISVVTDNDGDYTGTIERYRDYARLENIKLCVDGDNTYPTLEPQLVKANGLVAMNTLLDKNFATEEELIAFMINNKADCALRIFEKGEGVKIPPYILHAIQQ